MSSNINGKRNILPNFDRYIESSFSDISLYGQMEGMSVILGKKKSNFEVIAKNHGRDFYIITTQSRLSKFVGTAVNNLCNNSQSKEDKINIRGNNHYYITQ